MHQIVRFFPIVCFMLMLNACASGVPAAGDVPAETLAATGAAPLHTPVTETMPVPTVVANAPDLAKATVAATATVAPTPAVTSTATRAVIAPENVAQLTAATWEQGCLYGGVSWGEDERSVFVAAFGSLQQRDADTLETIESNGISAHITGEGQWASSFDSAKVLLWRLPGLEAARSFVAEAAARDVLVSGDGRLAAMTVNDRAEVWDTEKGERLLQAPDGSVRAINADGSLLATSVTTRWMAYGAWSSSTTLTVRYLPGGGTARVFGNYRNVSGVAFSPDGRYMVVGYSRLDPALEYYVELYEVTTGRALWRQKQSSASNFNFSPDGAYLFAGGLVVARVYNVADGEVIFTESTNGYAKGAFSPNGNRLLLADSVWLRIYDFVADKLLQELVETCVSTAALHPNGRTLVVGDDKAGELRLIDITSGDQTNSLMVSPETHTRLLAFTPDGQHLVRIQSGMGAGLWTTFDIESNEQLGPFRTSATFLAAALHTVEGYLTIRIGGAIAFYDALTGERAAESIERVSMGDIDFVDIIAYSHDGAYVASVGGTEQTVTLIYDLATYEAVATLPPPGGLTGTGLALDANGSRVAIAEEEAVRLYAVADGELLHELTSSPQPTIYSLAFSKDGRLLAATTPMSLLVWDTISGKLLREIPGSYSYLVFGSDGTQLLTWNWGTISVWQVARE